MYIPNSMIIYDYHQNINLTEGEPINYTFNKNQNTNQVQIEQNQNIPILNSSAILGVNGNMFKHNPSSIIINSTIIPPAIPSIKIDNHNRQLYQTERRNFRNRLDSLSPVHFENIANSLKPQKITHERNAFSLLEVNPFIEPPNFQNSVFKENQNKLVKTTNAMPNNYKLSDNYNNYFNYIKNAPNFSNKLNFTNNSKMIQNSNHELNSVVNNSLDNKFIYSKNEYSLTGIKNDSLLMENLNNSFDIDEVNNSFNSNFINNKNKKDNNNDYNDNYFLNNNNYDNNNYYNAYNENKTKKSNNINDIYNTNNINNYRNNNLIPIQYNKINDALKEEGPKPNFNLSEFLTIKEIGKGTEGIIYLVKWLKNGKEYALKKGVIKKLDHIIRKQEKIKMLKEFRNKTGNDGIIRIYGDKYIPRGDFYEFYEIMEFAEKDWDKEIYNIAHSSKKCYTENELLKIMYHIINIFALLQKNHITHRDIKPQNIMLVNGNFKISDFGNSRILKREGYIAQRVRGSEMFMSPIMFKGLHSKITLVKHNSYKSDVFSLGMCFLLAAACSYHPLNLIREIYDMNSIYKIINDCLGHRYSPKLLKILFSMLQVEENLRPDFIQLVSLFTK